MATVGRRGGTTTTGDRTQQTGRKNEATRVEIFVPRQQGLIVAEFETGNGGDERFATLGNWLLCIYVTEMLVVS